MAASDRDYEKANRNTSLWRWFFVPVAVIVVAILCCAMRWFDSALVTVGFASFSLPALYLWRRSSARLPRKLANWKQENFPPAMTKNFSPVFFSILAAALLLNLIALGLMLTVPKSWEPTMFVMTVTVLVWTSVAQFGMVDILSHFWVSRLLSGESPCAVEQNPFRC